MKERIIEEILKENTGSHFLDSGDYYGRHWERNQRRDFKSEPPCLVDVYDDQFVVTYNVYHFLVDHLIYTEECRRLGMSFNKFSNRPENWNKSWLQLMEEWLDYRGFGHHGVVNTYNYDNLLSQVLQYILFTTSKNLDDLEDDCYIILQVHNGCDVRGGYTKPRIFRVIDYYDFHVHQLDVVAYCSRCGASWTSEDCGVHWYTYNTDVKFKVIIRERTVLCPACHFPLWFAVGE